MALVQDLKTIQAAAAASLHLKLKNVSDAASQTTDINVARRTRRASLVGRRSLSIDFDDTSVILDTRKAASDMQNAESARPAAAPALIVQSKLSHNDWQAPDPSAIAVAYTVTGDPVGPGPAARRTRYTTYVWSSLLPPAIPPQAVSVPLPGARSPARGSPASASSVAMQAHTRVTSYRVFDKDACLASVTGGPRKAVTSYRRLHLWRYRAHALPPSPMPVPARSGMEAAAGLVLPPMPAAMPPPVMPMVMDRARAGQSWQCAPCTQ